MSLRDQLVGAWRLVSYTETAEEGGEPSHPLGDDAGGLLVYAADGHMSVTMMRADRPAFASGDWFRFTPDEVAAAAAFIAYAGRWSIDEAASTVTHEVELSFFPNWIGREQVRRLKLEGDDLTLVPTTAIRSGGRSAFPRLRWRRGA